MNLSDYSFPLIRIKYVCPTDKKGSRVKATHFRDSEKRWSASVEYDGALSKESNYKAAVEKLIATWPFGDRFKILTFAHDAKGNYCLVISTDFNI